MGTQAYIGLGSNLGDRMATLSAAVRELSADARVEVLAVSPAFESEPWGVEEQPPFANAVVCVCFRGDADDLLALLKDIERRLGRTEGTRFGPRPIDLDLLLFGNETRYTPALTIPHPRMLERDFVVTPLLEIAPGLRMPDGARIDPGQARFGRVTSVLGPIPGLRETDDGGRPA